MTLKQIEGFCYLAQTLNFTRAAEMLYMSQPAFSRLIVSLEEELGCTLFIRSKVDPKLTLAGEQIYQHMKVIRREHEDITGIARLAGTDQLGSLSIGILDNGLTAKSKKIISDFRKNHPFVEVLFKEYTEVEIFRALEMGWIDVAFLAHFPEALRQTMDGVVTETSRVSVIMHHAHPMASLSEVSIAGLRNEKFILLRENKSEMGFNTVMLECLQHGFSPEIVMKADSVSSALAAVACGIGITILPDSLKAYSDESVVFVPVEGSAPWDHWLVWTRDTLNNSVHSFIKYVVKSETEE